MSADLALPGAPGLVAREKSGAPVVTKPKGQDKPSITYYLPQTALDELDAEINAAVAGIPGARLSRGAWTEQVVLRELAALKAKRAPAQAATAQAPEPSATPKKRRAA
jgi:hypothetical protein